MSKYTEALNEITKYQVELEYTMQGTDKWRNVMWTCKEALKIADKLEQVNVRTNATKHLDEMQKWERLIINEDSYFEGYKQAFADIRGIQND